MRGTSVREPAQVLAGVQFQCHGVPLDTTQHSDFTRLPSADPTYSRSTSRIPPLRLCTTARQCSNALDLRPVGRSRAGLPRSPADRFPAVQLATEAVLLAAEAVELHLAVQGRGVDQRVLGRQVDAAAVLAQDPGEVVLLGAAEILLQRDLVVVAGLAAVAVVALASDARVPRQVDLPDDGAAGPQDRALDDVSELAHVAGPDVAHQLRQRLVGQPVDPLVARHLAVAQALADQ